MGPRVLILAAQLGDGLPPALIERLALSCELQVIVASERFVRDAAAAGAVADRCPIEVFAAQTSLELDLMAGIPRQVCQRPCPDASDRVSELLAYGGVDLVHAEGFALMRHVPEWSGTPLLLVERQLGRWAPRPMSNLDVLFQTARACESQLACWRRADCVGVGSDADREVVRSRLPGADVRVLDGDARLLAVYRELAPVPAVA